jgi:hypothetical protein
MSHAGRPSELALTLAALPGRYATSDGWVYADQVRFQLARLGFGASTQQVAAWLGAMSRAEAPWVEVRDGYGTREYRVTRFGTTDIDNRWPGVRPVAPWLT